MTSPTIGELRHRLSLQSAARAPDGGGGVSLAWSTIAEVSGAIRPVAGSEALDADRLSGRITHEVWIRHRAGVAAVMRFVLGARVFDIRAVLDPGERRRWLRCLVEERVS